MFISYKAVYHLLERHYRRRTLNEYIVQEIPDNALEGSIIFAHELPDYHYLSVMVEKRDYLDRNYVMFFNKKQHLSICLEKDVPLTILKFAMLYLQCDIHSKEFEEVIEAQAEGSGSTPAEWVDAFHKIVSFLQDKDTAALTTVAAPKTEEEE